MQVEITQKVSITTKTESSTSTVINATSVDDSLELVGEVGATISYAGVNLTKVLFLATRSSSLTVISISWVPPPPH